MRLAPIQSLLVRHLHRYTRIFRPPQMNSLLFSSNDLDALQSLFVLAMRGPMSYVPEGRSTNNQGPSTRSREMMMAASPFAG